VREYAVLQFASISLKQLQQKIRAQPLTNNYCYTAAWPMGGATAFKLGGGTEQDSRAERAKKNCNPTFPNVRGVQASKYQ